MGQKNILACRRYGLLALAFVAVAATTARSEPIETILVDYVGIPGPPPLAYDYDEIAQEGTLSVAIDSLTILVERSVGGETVPEFISGVSFTLTAEVLTDLSSPPLAAGMFASVQFELSAGETTLLAGSNLVNAELIYAETAIRDVMLIAGGDVPITGGALAADFDVAATLAGLGFLIQPSTDDFDSLDVDHSGAIKVNINPIPEPASGLLFVLVAGLCGRRRRHA